MMKLLFLTALIFSQLIFANEMLAPEKEYYCMHSSYNLSFKLKFAEDKRPSLTYFWKLSQGNVTGRPDFQLSKVELTPVSDTNGEYIEYKLLNDSNSPKNLYIYLDESKLELANNFEASDSKHTTIRAKCQLSVLK